MTTRSFISAVLILLMALSAITALLFRPVPVVVRTNLEQLPMTIVGYTAIEDRFSDSVYRELNVDKSVYRHYRSQDGDQIDLYIGYYGTAKGGRTGHNPNACLPGAGWAIVNSQRTKLRRASQHENSEVNLIHARKDGINTVMIHWYQTSNSAVVSTGIGLNINKFRNLISKNRNDGAFISVSTTFQQNDSEMSLRKIEIFSEQLMQLIPKYWPEER